MPRDGGSGLSPVCISPKVSGVLGGIQIYQFHEVLEPGWCGIGVPWSWARSAGVSRPPGPQSLPTHKMGMMKTAALCVVLWESLGKKYQTPALRDRALADPGCFGEGGFLLLFSPEGHSQVPFLFWRSIQRRFLILPILQDTPRG